MELLERFTREGSEAAFAEVVRRHLNLVYSAALRQVRQPHLAEEVAQSVFLELAGAASRLKPDSVLAAWLYDVTRRRAINAIRGEVRRRHREHIAWEITQMNSADEDWSRIEPILDEAMSALGSADRTAILLHYFENKSLREVGQALGTTEDAARKRVSRAVERLRNYFGRRSISIGAAGLVADIAANAVQAAPSGLAAAISSSALGAHAAMPAAAGFAKLLSAGALHGALAALIITLSAGAWAYENHRASALTLEARALRLSHEQSVAVIGQGRSHLDQAMHDLAALRSESDQLSARLAALEGDSAELATMKAAMVTAQAAAPTGRASAMLKAWLDRIARLQQRLRRNPAQAIPEMGLLTPQDWLNATATQTDYRLTLPWGRPAPGEDPAEVDDRQALSRLRNLAENEFVRRALQPALNRYIQANHGQFPGAAAQLQPYLANPADAEILQRYTVSPAGAIDNLPALGGDLVITPQTAADPEYDSRICLGPDGIASTERGYHAPTITATGSAADILAPIAHTFSSQNNGAQFTDISQLLPYVANPQEEDTVRGMMTLAPVFKAYAAANQGAQPSRFSDLLRYAADPKQQAAVARMMQLAGTSE